MTDTTTLIEHVVDLNGRTLSVIEAGDGPRTLVLLHGIGSSARSWTTLLPILAPHVRCLAWDLPGYGGSDPLDVEKPIALDYLPVLDSWLTREAVERPIILGHSLGALIAGEAARQWPDRVAGLILADPASGHGLTTAHEWPTGLTRRISDLQSLGQPAFAAVRAPRMCAPEASIAARQTTEREMARVKMPGYAQAVALLAQADLAAILPHTACPLTFMVGAEDRVTPPAGVRRLAAVRPEADCIELPGAGHAGYVETPSLYAAPILAMLEQVR